MPTNLDIDRASQLADETTADLRSDLFGKLKNLTPEQRDYFVENLKPVIDAVREKARDLMVILRTNGMYEEFVQYAEESRDTNCPMKIINAFFELIKIIAAKKSDDTPITKKDVAEWMASKEFYLKGKMGLGGLSAFVICNFLKDSNLIEFSYKGTIRFPYPTQFSIQLSSKI